MKMERSILLSRIALWIFLVLLLCVDLFSWPLAAGIAALLQDGASDVIFYSVLFFAVLILVSIPAYIAIVKLMKLLKNLQRGEIFTKENTKYLHVTSSCLVAAAAIFVIGTVFYTPFAILVLACGFMALIVHVVKNVFEKALSMKDELDLTV